jgi:hypothetical protein
MADRVGEHRILSERRLNVSCAVRRSQFCEAPDRAQPGRTRRAMFAASAGADLAPRNGVSDGRCGEGFRLPAGGDLSPC